MNHTLSKSWYDLMSHEARLNQACSYFFFGGFVFSKVHHFPLPLFSLVFDVISLGFYAIGYLLWFIVCFLNPEQNPLSNQWFGFAEFREQFKISAAIGLVATLMSLVAIALPMLLIPASLLFLASNLIWAIGEYHKLHNPPLHEPQFKSNQQKDYVAYAKVSTVLSMLGVIAITLILIFPAMAIPVTIVTTIIGGGIGALGFEYWLASKFTAPIEESHKKMLKSLQPIKPCSELEPKEPYHSKGLLKTTSSAKIPLDNLQNACKIVL